MMSSLTDHLRIRIGRALLLAMALSSTALYAQSEARPTSVSDKKETSAEREVASEEVVPEKPVSLIKARDLYLEGVQLAKKAEWSTALGTFEASRKLHPHAMTTYNIGACQRALGHYTQARREFKQAIAQEVDALPESLREQATAFLAEIERVLVTVTVSIRPIMAGIAVDGRPLTSAGMDPQAKIPRYVAGLEAPGTGKSANKERFIVVLDPGSHVLTLSRKGYGDAIVNKTFPPGYSGTINLELDLLPATLHVSSNQPDALLKLNGADMGPAPLDVLRPAGIYQLRVEKKNFVPYKVEVDLAPGEEVTLAADLVAEKPSIFTKWWFWTGAAAVVAGATAATYYATRPEPTRPDPEAGTLGWIVETN